MLIPDEQDIPLINLLSGDFKGRKYHLFENPSPVLPLHFDKKYLPKNICERQYLSLYECLLMKDRKGQSDCSYEIAKFQNCRKIRDTSILKGIKQWELNHISQLDKKNRQMYLQGLTFKLDRLKNEYERLPSTQAKQFTLIQMESQIQQIKWRMKYIQKKNEKL